MKSTELKNYDVSVKEEIDYWEFQFSAKYTDCLDGKPYVVINKTNGEIIRSYRYGKPAE